MSAHLSRVQWVFALVLTVTVAGYAGGPAAGEDDAAAARGPEAQVEASVNTVTRAAYDVLEDMGFAITEVDFDEDDGQVDIDAQRGDTEVDIRIEPEAPRYTEIEVSVDDDDDVFDDVFDEDEEDEAYARRILQEIVNRVS